MHFDLSERELHGYRSDQLDPDDFDQFWRDTLAESGAFAQQVVLDKVDTGLTTVDVFDLTFAGYRGQPVRGWLRVPAGARGPLPAIVEYCGYGGGRGSAVDNLFWASAGYVHVTMDTRGQGAAGSRGETFDPEGGGPQIAGFMTRGIESPETYFYRRVFTDAVRAVEATRSLDIVDPAQVTVAGGSQGGGIALAAAGLVPDVLALFSWVPFLCDYRRGSVITDEDPFREITRYLGTHTDMADEVHRVLSYFDGVNFAKRAKAPGWFTTGLMDTTCPPSTVFGAYNNYGGRKEMTVWPYNGHEGGRAEDLVRALRALNQLRVDVSSATASGSANTGVTKRRIKSVESITHGLLLITNLTESDSFRGRGTGPVVARHDSMEKSVKRRTLLGAVGAITVAALALGGCASTGSGGKPDTLQMWLPPTMSDTGSSDSAVWKELLAPWEKENDVKVDVTIVSWASYEAKMLTGMSSGSGPDVTYMYNEMVADYIERNQLLPLDEHLTADDKANFLYLDKGQIDGKQYMMPYIVGGARVMYYNKEILAESGVDTPPATWDEFVDALKKIKAAGYTPFLQQWGDPNRSMMNEMFHPFLWQAGGDLFNEDGTATGFDTPEAIKAAEFLYSLKEDGLMPDSVTGINADQVQEQFRSGKVGFMSTSDASMPTFVEAGIDLGVIDSLQEEEQGTFVAVDSLVVPKNCT